MRRRQARDLRGRPLGMRRRLRQACHVCSQVSHPDASDPEAPHPEASPTAGELVAGRVLRILNKTKFDFGEIASNGTIDLLASGPVDVSQWKSATMIIRVFAVNIAAGGEIKISAVPWGTPLRIPRRTASGLLLPAVLPRWTAAQLHRRCF